MEEGLSIAENKLIKFNVGGVKCQTTWATISMRGENFLTMLVRHVLLSKQMTSTVDEEGCFFIDRNGKLFEVILDYLRTGDLFVPAGLEAKNVEREFQFYQIALPVPTNLCVPLLQNLMNESEPMKEAEKFLQHSWEEIEECIRRRASSCEDSYRLTCSKYWYKLADGGHNVEVGLKNKFKFQKQISLDKIIRCIARLIKKKWGLRTSVSTQRWKEAQRTDYNLDIEWAEIVNETLPINPAALLPVTSPSQNK